MVSVSVTPGTWSDLSDLQINWSFYSYPIDELGYLNLNAPGGIGVTTLGYPFIPEPSAFVLLGTGLVCLIGYVWRRRKG